MKRLFSGSILMVIYVLIFSISTCYAQEYSILIKGGHVIDPKNHIDQTMDVAIRGDTIAAVAKNINADLGKTVIDASGLYVSPGFVDIHVHTFWGTDWHSFLAGSPLALPIDPFSFRNGVTTAVDAGCAGWRNFPIYKRRVIDHTKTRLLAFLNITGSGMYSRYKEQNKRDFNPEMTALMIERKYPDLIVGIKAPHYWGRFAQVDSAVKAGRMAHVPVMVDFGEHEPPNSIKSLFFDHLRPGDIFTHTYSSVKGREAVVDSNFKVKPFVFKAQKRGIIFDVGHGAGSWYWWQAVPAIKQGFLPNSISTDLYRYDMNRAMIDMDNVMSKFLALGLSIQQVILRSTWNPAKEIQRPKLGNLSVGAPADVAIFKILKGNFGFVDSRGRKFKGTKRIKADLTIHNGQVVYDLNGLGSPLWKGGTEPRIH